jgi:A/G-specific adenine glycosylase
MLQQTQVDRVVPFFERFIGAFPTPQALAEASLDEVLRLWAGLGYYSRARHLHATAQVLVSEHGGSFPGSWECARALPGVGEYTAGAVLSIAYGRPLPAVDANARRVLARVLRVDGSRPRARHRMERFAAKAVPLSRPGDYNQALMELGSLVCRPSGPDCEECCLGDLCLTRQYGPVKSPPVGREQKVALEQVSLAVVRRRGRVLLAQRPLSGLWPGLWEFPNCLLNAEDDPQAALAGLLGRDFSLEADIGGQITGLHYGVMRRRLHLTAYVVSATGRVVASSHVNTRWAAPSSLTAHALPSPHQRVAQHLADLS